jgi:hypothetical protein
MARKLEGLDQAGAKKVVLQQIAKGATVAAAMELVNRVPKTYENWMATDKEFHAEVDRIRGNIRRAERDDKPDPTIYSLSFAEWRERFLHQKTYPHQQMWIDVLEGREPDLYHPAITYVKGHSNRVVINTPPGHSKSTVITTQYVVYKLCMNPAFRVLIVSKTMEFAAKFLLSVKQYLTDPAYMELQLAYAPSGGWKPDRGEGRWGNSMIYLAGRSDQAVDKAAKDPSVQAIGIGGHIYGSRTDLTILDDAVDDTNVHAYAKQFDWLTRTVLSRGRSAKVLIVGTRIAPVDLYSHLLNDDIYTNGKSPWTYLAQPAVLEFAENPEDWKTLWPRSTQPFDEASEDEPDENGEFPVWDGPTLAKVRSENRPAVWALVYLQQQTSDEMTFSSACVWGSVDKRRQPGPLQAGALGHPKYGSEGMQIIGSIDPAGTGTAFILVYALDRRTKERYVLNAWIKTETLPSWYQDMVKQVTPQYGVTEWVIEAQGYSNWIYHDEVIMQFCQQRGIKITPHYTGSGNKIDPDFGVASMSSLFGTLVTKENLKQYHNGDNIIHLPNPDKSAGVKALIDQLVTWIPGVSGAKLRQDGPMALWFAETRARIYVSAGNGPARTHAQNKYLSRRAAARQYVAAARNY